MSYCRWSSMNWRCDAYVYEDCSGGFTTHVAGRRRVIQPIPDLMGGRISMWLHRWSGCAWDRGSAKITYSHRWRGAIYSAWSRFVGFWHRWVHRTSMDLIPLRDIGLPHDGESFNDDTASECADRLERLRALGYIIPQYAIDALRKEAMEI